MAWMATMSDDHQAVLATDKVRFQGQEVAFVIADDHYAARDALELIDVEYEPLEAVVNARRALEPDAPVIRDDLERWPQQSCLRLGDRRRGGDRGGLRARDVVVEQDMVFPRSHPAPMETCGAIADHDPVSGRLTVWCTTQAPHAHRTLYTVVTGLPEHKHPRGLARRRRRIRQQGPGLSRLRLRDRGLDDHRAPGEVGRGPLGEPDVDRLRPRLRDAGPHRRDAGGPDHGARGRRPRRPRRVQRGRPAQPLSGRLLQRVHRLLRPRGRALPRDRGPHEQGPGRRRVLVLVPHRRGRLPRRAARRLPRARARRRPRRPAPAQPAAPRAVPLRDEDRLGLRLGRLRARAAQGARPRRLRRPAPRAGGRAGAGRAHGDRCRVLHRGRRRRAAEAYGHVRPGHERRRGAARVPDRQGAARDQRADPGPGPRDDVRADRRRGARHRARRRRRRARRHRHDSVRPGHVRLALDPGQRRGRRAGRAQGARAGADRRRGDARGRAGRPRVDARPLGGEGRPGAGRDDPGHRGGGARGRSSCPRASRPASTPRRSTTRRTSRSRSAPTSASWTSTRAPRW